jgi:hypothetical protein
VSLTTGKFGCTEVTCEYFILAVARTKKQAKQQAAFKMLNTLRTSLADVLTVTGSDKGDAVSEKVYTVIVSAHHVTHIWEI